MARRPRLNLPGIPQHIIQRGNNRQACFFHEQDYAVYLDKLDEFSKKAHVDIHAYVLMTNHVHMLATPSTENGVSKLMQNLGRFYVRYINQTYHRSGTLWEGRFKSSLVDTDSYFLLVSRYIELNPVRASMVEHPAEYPWSSYKHNALGKKITLITPHISYTKLGSTNVTRETNYRSLFKGHIPDRALVEIRQAINKTWVLGSERFIQQISEQTGLTMTAESRGGDRKSRAYQEKTRNHLL